VTDALVPPAVPASLEAAGWERVDERTETLFELAAVRIRGATVQYEDERTRDAFRQATGIDHALRFFAATQLDFQPSLPPGVSPKLVASTLRSEVRRRFTEKLADRGLVDIEYEESERRRLPDRSRVRMLRFTATAPLDDHPALPLECWVTVWIAGRTVRIISAGHPAANLAERDDIDTDEELLARSLAEYREHFFETLEEMAK